LEENIDRVYTGRPTKKDRKITIRQFFIQLCGCPKFIGHILGPVLVFSCNNN
jgi:uncharacterized Tic20 family protein